ncbi:MAG: hypothetical protein KA180_07735 [Gemmatimonadales bacterium]|nr:hypothetical protein [Gemmatimonadales bacterium]
MALTFRRWCLLLLLLLAAGAVVLLPPNGLVPFELTGALTRWWYSYDRAPSRDALRQEQLVLGRELSRARRELDHLILRDSLPRWVPATAPAVSLVLRGEVPAPIAARMHRLTDSLARALAPLGPLPGSLALVVVADTAGTAPLLEGTHLLLPPAGEAGRCALVVPSRALRRAEGVRQAEESLAPCVFYAAFGPAGPQVERWLFHRGFDLARAADWWEPAVARDSARLDVRWWSPALVAYMFDRAWQPLGSIALMACRAGRSASCAPALLGRSDVRIAPVQYDRAQVLSALAWWGYESELGVQGLARDLVREFGPQRFRAFWTSPAPPAQAFEGAFGVRFDAWAPRWVPAALGRTVVGPSLRVGGVLAWLSVVGLALGGAVLMARRRQLG